MSAVAEVSAASPPTTSRSSARPTPTLFGIAIATVDGQVYAVGDADVAFTIQSVSKPFMYG